MNYPEHRHERNGPWTDKDWLYNQYITQGKRSLEIANEFGCKQSTIQGWLRKHNIKKEKDTRYHAPKYPYQSREYLYEAHIVQGKSMSQIARENNVSHDAIAYYLDKYSIPRNPTVCITKFTQEEIDQIQHLYCDEKLSAYRISKMLNISHRTVLRLMRARGINTRDWSEAQFNANKKDIPPLLLDANALQRMHWDLGMSCKDIGAYVGVDPGTVRRHMHGLGLETKDQAESKVGILSGDRHHNWKGGVTALNYLLREYFNINLMPLAAKRDNYTCQYCVATHTVLHVHHIRPFSEIVGEICGEYPELKPNDEIDKQLLYQIIVRDERFLSLDNLITLCKECHLYKAHNYKRKTISSQVS